MKIVSSFRDDETWLDLTNLLFGNNLQKQITNRVGQELQSGTKANDNQQHKSHFLKNSQTHWPQLNNRGQRWQKPITPLRKWWEKLEHQINNPLCVSE